MAPTPKRFATEQDKMNANILRDLMPRNPGADRQLLVIAAITFVF
jgi:hypothetical protein